ncbi:MAG TPA: PIN domain-containing protein [Chloroflexota bacterium]|nr:PIN domain-containing protein [Chloroflexota bacterium]HUM67303.1 PIN domain-containing protein [Chloroflexota bacterium]
MSGSRQPLCFVDSNIWLYALLPKQAVIREKAAKNLIQQKQSTILISTQVVNEVVNNLLRKGQAKEPGIRLLIASFYDQHQVTRTDRTIQEKASFLRESYSFSHWDSLLVAAALEAGASIMYSEDMHHGLVVGNQLTIINPFI